MLKTVRKLIDYVEGHVRYGIPVAEFLGMKFPQKNFGNHWVTVSLQDGHAVVNYGYHWTVICKVELDAVGNVVSVKYDNGGWNTPSTTRAINSYKAHYGEEL